MRVSHKMHPFREGSIMTNGLGIIRSSIRAFFMSMFGVIGAILGLMVVVIVLAGAFSGKVIPRTTYDTVIRNLLKRKGSIHNL